MKIAISWCPNINKHWHNLFVFTIHSDQCWRHNAIMPVDHFATPAQFTHQSNNSTAGQLSHTASSLVFHQSRLQKNRGTCWHSDQPARPPKWYSCYSHYVYTLVAALYLTLVLSWTVADSERPLQLPLKSFVGGLTLVLWLPLSFTTSQLPHTSVSLSIVCLSPTFLS